VTQDFITNFTGAHLLVAGEVGIDEYIWGDTRRISPEAPVPVVEVERTELKLGLGANVAQNITALGGKVTLVSVRGNDEDGKRLDQMLAAEGIQKTCLLTDDSRPTMRKVRVIAQRQHVVRIDYEKNHPLNAGLAKRFNDSICDLLPSCDGVIVQDYGKGLWNADTMAFAKQAKALNKPVFVDPSRVSPVGIYKDTTLLTPNTAEAEILAELPPSASRRQAGKDDEYLKRMGKIILDRTGAPYVVITCGEHGMVALKNTGELTRIPTFARDVFDVTGAGDTVVSVLALMWVLGHPLSRCMQVANAAAGIVVGRIGTATVSPDELRQELDRLEASGHITN
jgi:rfaE bifunctional protein kinase chain/domain